jgi:hypothetical protein
MGLILQLIAASIALFFAVAAAFATDPWRATRALLVTAVAVSALILARFDAAAVAALLLLMQGGLAVVRATHPASPQPAQGLRRRPLAAAMAALLGIGLLLALHAGPVVDANAEMAAAAGAGEIVAVAALSALAVGLGLLALLMPRRSEAGS